MQLSTGCAYKFTKSELDDLLNSAAVLIDTREKKNQHIIDYLDDKDVAHESRKLEFGDYSIKLPADPEKGFPRDIYFDDALMVERKKNCTELSANFAQNRSRFERQLSRSRDSKLVIVIEQADGYERILKQRYKTEFNPKSFIATMHAFRHRYDAEVNFIGRSYVGNFIYYTLYYWLREWLK